MAVSRQQPFVLTTAQACEQQWTLSAVGAEALMSPAIQVCLPLLRLCGVLGALVSAAVSARIRTLQDLQKRLTTDLKQATEVQEQYHQQCQQVSERATDLPTQHGPPEPVAANDGSDSKRLAADISTSSRQRTGHRCSSWRFAGREDATVAGTGAHDVYVHRLSQLLATAGPRVTALQEQLDDVITKFKWTAEYYCEDVDRQAWKQQPVSFLTYFLDLLDGLAATQKDTARLARVTAMLSEFVELQQQAQQQQAPGGRRPLMSSSNTSGADSAGVLEDGLDDILLVQESVSSTGSSPTTGVHHQTPQHEQHQQAQQFEAAQQVLADEVAAAELQGQLDTEMQGGRQAQPNSNDQHAVGHDAAADSPAGRMPRTRQKWQTHEVAVPLLPLGIEQRPRNSCCQRALCSQ